MHTIPHGWLFRQNRDARGNVLSPQAQPQGPAGKEDVSEGDGRLSHIQLSGANIPTTFYSKIFMSSSSPKCSSPQRLFVPTEGTVQVNPAWLHPARSAL